MAKILILNKYYDNVIGGVETVVKDYSILLSKYHEITILACNNKVLTPTIRYKAGPNILVNIAHTLFIFKKLPISISYIINFIKISKKSDIIYLHEPFPLGSFLCSFLPSKKKIVVTWHSDIYKQKFLSALVAPFQKSVLRKANLVTTTSETLLSHSELLKNFKSKTEIIPLAIECQTPEYELSLVDPVYKNYILKHERFCLFFGRLSYYKGLNLIIEAFLLNPSIPILVVGKGEAGIEKKLSDLSLKFSQNFLFVNRFLSENEKTFLLSKSSIFLFPSNRVTEAFGITQLEAMRMGVPIINCEIPTGVPWVSLNDVTGITIKNESVIDFSNAIKLLYSEPALCMQLGINGQRRLKELFSTDVIYPKVVRMIDQLL